VLPVAASIHTCALHGTAQRQNPQVRDPVNRRGRRWWPVMRLSACVVSRVFARPALSFYQPHTLRPRLPLTFVLMPLCLFVIFSQLRLIFVNRSNRSGERMNAQDQNEDCFLITTTRGVGDPGVLVHL
jgi:hypothetical protein